MFEKKKLSAEVRREQLIVRVGGGWTPVEDFLRFFSEKLSKERQKVRKTDFQRLQESTPKSKGLVVRRVLPSGQRRSLTLRLPTMTP